MFTLLTTGMQQVGRAEGAASGGGNPTKRLRIRLPDTWTQEQVIDVLGLFAVEPAGSSMRLPAEELRRVTSEHIYEAVELLRHGDRTHPFDESNKFDVLVDGAIRLAPKAVFGLAATMALGKEVRPENFTGG